MSESFDEAEILNILSKHRYALNQQYHVKKLLKLIRAAQVKAVREALETIRYSCDVSETIDLIERDLEAGMGKEKNT